MAQARRSPLSERLEQAREWQNISNALSTVYENLVSFMSLCYKSMLEKLPL